MDVELLNRDLGLLHSRVGTEIRGVDWSMDDPRDRWIVIWGGVRVPVLEPENEPSDPGRRVFNRPDVNVRLPVPQDLYDRDFSRGGQVRFYTALFIDSGLRIWVPSTRVWRVPGRYHENRDPYTGSQLKGWSYLCVIPAQYVNPNINVMSALTILQKFLLNEA